MPSAIDLETLPDAALVVGDDGVVVAVNALMTELLGCDMTGVAIVELLRCKELEGARDAPLRHARAEVVGHDRVPFAADASATTPRDGRRIVFLHKLDAPRLIEESERLLRVAFETAPIGMAFFNTAGEYLRVNAALCALLERSEPELLGRRDQEFTHPDH